MDASVPVDSRVFVQKRALRKYLADSGLTDVVKPGGRQYTLKHVKVLVEAISMLSCLLYTSPSPRDLSTSRMPSSA